MGNQWEEKGREKLVLRGETKKVKRSSEKDENIEA